MQLHDLHVTVGPVLVPAFVRSARHAMYKLRDLYMPVLLVPVRLRIVAQPSVNREPDREHLQRVNATLA